jgi:ABC-type branched-subunit amino acid transport system substrate-binding protein
MKRMFIVLQAPNWISAAALALTLISAPAIAQTKIGFQAPLTGPAATDGVSAKVAAELAIERTNAAGGVLGQKAELAMYDDQAKTEEAVFTANKLVGQDGVKFAVSGSYSASGRAAAPIVQTARCLSSPLTACIQTSPAPETTHSAPCIWVRRKAGPERNSSATT